MLLASPPPRASYRFVLRETNHNPEVSQAFTSYDEAADSRCIQHPDGIVACTLFLFSENARNRATKLGWVDVSDPWFARLDGAVVAPAVQEAPVSASVAAGSAAPGGSGLALSPRRRAG